MEISGRGRATDLAKYLLGVQEAGQPAGKAAAKPKTSDDQVNISEQAKELRRITALTKEPDPVRAEKVERLRRAIDSGTYNVDGRAVGDAIIRQALTDKVL